MLGLVAVRDTLARPIGPAGLKSALSALNLAVNELIRAGYNIGADEGADAPTMTILEYTPDELVEIRREAEAAYHGGGPDQDALD